MAGAAALLLGMLAVPASAESDGTGEVGATVTVGDYSTCIQLTGWPSMDPIETLDFGVLEFGDHRMAPVTRPEPDHPDYFVVSCTERWTQEIYVGGTDATNADETIGWSLTSGGQIEGGWPNGSPGLNEFVVEAGGYIDENTTDGESITLSSEENQLYGRFEPEEEWQVQHALSMPDFGSDGIGEEMGFDIIWTAVAFERFD